MKKAIKMPSIEHFSSISASINRRYNFVGLDENGDAIYDKSIPKPILTFKGTIKLHGTNASVAYNKISGIWYQSKESIITPQNDNAGFAFFANSNEKVFLSLIEQVETKESIDTSTNSITIYGEWVGAGIQKGVGVCNLPKSLFIFGVKITPIVDVDDEEAVKNNPSYWVDSSYLRSPEHKIYNIEDYDTFSIDIDFNVPQLSQNKILELTLQVETECPVAKAFGFPETIGEGLVWTCEFNGDRYRFKSKGDKHAGKSKVKTVSAVDDEKIKKVLELADAVTPAWRLSQGLTETFNLNNGGELDVKKMGEYIRWVINDVIKEESDTLVEAGLEIKDVSKYISDIARRYFFDNQLV